MAREDNQKQPAKPHSVTMDNRSLLSVTGVEDVESFDENEIIMSTSQGNLIVRGSGLHISTISLDTGELKVAGIIIELSYEEPAPAGGLWSRLFG
jgi:sporulation protein YabP